jgi:hypothetical protein
MKILKPGSIGFVGKKTPQSFTQLAHKSHKMPFEEQNIIQHG